MKPLLLAFYGDDFTGSADVMEVLQWSGLRTVLFLDPPDREQLAAFGDLRAFGVAGSSRAMSPSEMETELRPAFAQLRDSGAACVHYKTCSTFDSSPDIGSIGKAIELGRDAMGERLVPIVVGAPNLGRYQVFGNLFARSGLDTEPFRLDRHPTMRQHPITPMDEADLRLHLAAQTKLAVELVDVLRLDAAKDGQLALQLAQSESDAVLFDVLTSEHLIQIGQALQQMIDDQPSNGEQPMIDGTPRFFVGSSGIEYALTSFWAQNDQLERLQSRPATRPSFGATEQLLVLTGSCSPVNDRQIGWAESNGFETIAIDTPQLIDPQRADRAMDAAIEEATARLKRGANVILHSSRGPGDARMEQTIEAMRGRGFSEREIKLHSGRMLGPKLGRILREVVSRHPLPRLGVAGGDTSGYVARELGIMALEAIAPIAPGSPLCRSYAGNSLDGIEFFFKGGQVGKDDVWGTMLRGTEMWNSGIM